MHISTQTKDELEVNDNKKSCIVIAICGLLFVLSPIALISYGLILAPVGLKIFFVIWILIVLGCFSFIKENSIKFACSLLVTLVYSLSLATWYAEDVLDGYFGNGGLGDTIGTFLLTFFTLIPLYLAGTSIRGKINEIKSAKIQKQLDTLNIELSVYQSNIKKIELDLKGRKKFVSLLSLMDMCGADSSQIRTNQKINNISVLTTALYQEKKKIEEVKAKIDKLSSVNNGGE